MDRTQTMWEMDNTMTIALTGDKTCFDYYERINCHKQIDKIKIPSLFISCLDDPVCKPEYIPMDDLYFNENIFTMILSKGGHG